MWGEKEAVQLSGTTSKKKCRQLQQTGPVVSVRDARGVRDSSLLFKTRLQNLFSTTVWSCFYFCRLAADSSPAVVSTSEHSSTEVRGSRSFHTHP